MADTLPFTIREIGPDEYEALGEVTVPAYWLWSFVLTFEEPA